MSGVCAKKLYFICFSFFWPTTFQRFRGRLQVVSMFLFDVDGRHTSTPSRCVWLLFRHVGHTNQPADERIRPSLKCCIAALNLSIWPLPPTLLWSSKLQPRKRSLSSGKGEKASRRVSFRNNNSVHLLPTCSGKRLFWYVNFCSFQQPLSEVLLFNELECTGVASRHRVMTCEDV